MKTQILLPNKFKWLGWLILFVSVLLWIYMRFGESTFSFLECNTFTIVSDEIFEPTQFFAFVKTNLSYTVVGVLFIVGGLLVSFSREKIEDEYIARLRLSAFQWAVLVNYVLLLLSFLLVYGGSFLTVMVYNMFTVLILFIVKFNYSILKGRKNYEE